MPVIPLSEVRQAEQVVRGEVVRTPLLRLNLDLKGGKKIFLKCENLQPIGSFKLRGAYNALHNIPKSRLTNGVYTASAGNFAQGLAWACSKWQIPCDVIVPDHAPRAKVEAIGRLGGNVTKVTFDTWWKVIQEHTYKGMKGTFVHPVTAPDVMAGNGTIGLEILDDLQEVDAVVVPFGGGGLVTGIASVFKQCKPNVKIYACEVETAAPLKASLKAGKASECQHAPSFVDGIGGKSVLPEMWPYVSKLVDQSVVVTLKDVCDAVKLLAERNHMIVEGAGGAAIAAALSGEVEGENVVCVLSGGNIDTEKLVKILNGVIP